MLKNNDFHSSVATRENRSEIEEPIVKKLYLIRSEIDEKITFYSTKNPVHPDLVPFVNECNCILLSTGAKRIRSIISVLMSESLDLDREQCLLIGVIIEMLHFTSLVHDDVIDGETLRRGHPTLNSRFANNHAVLIGDFMMCELITHSMDHNYSDKVIRLLVQAVKDLVTGVIIEQRVLPKKPNVAKYIEMVEHKTGSLFQLAFGLPLIITEKFPSAYACGNLFGLLFQIYDDFLDQETDGQNQNIFHFASASEIKELWDSTNEQLTSLSSEIGIEAVVSDIICYLQSHDYFRPDFLS